KYRLAADLLRTWQEEHIMIRDPEPALYFLSQEFKGPTGLTRRLALIGAIDIEPLGATILPHERTLPKHVDDRLKLLEATRAQTGQIFLIYEDADRMIDAVLESYQDRHPVLTGNLDGIQTSLWKCTDTTLHHTIGNALSSSTALIADGHHRYQTACRYAAAHPENRAAQQVMVTLVNRYHPGLAILPTHRLVEPGSPGGRELCRRLQAEFKTGSALPADQWLNHWRQAAGQEGIGVLDLTTRTGFWLPLPQAAEREDLLAVEFLHDHILKPWLKIDVDRPDSLARLDYWKGDLKPEDLPTLARKFELAFLVPPPSLEAVFRRSRSGHILPQKSTFFSPKIPSGLVFRSVQEYSGSEIP
ncbi:MAG: DUF1015 domain-containing protein, partial [Candidatus Neomarinimicrobiota bacterium]